MTLTYKEAGVDVTAGDQLVDWLRKPNQVSKALQQKQKQVLQGIGGFAALYKAKFPGCKSPTLVTCTDGVGTKVLVASRFNDFSSIGQDLVAMCVNDLICTGGEPLLFLDYYACGELRLADAKSFLTGLRKACHEASSLLIGGETAEMPGVYQAGHFDCAGFAVGVVDQSKILGPHKVKKGDRLIAVASSGFHSNGYSLLRKVFADDMEKWKDELLRPTALYVSLAQALKGGRELKAMAHITGGGLDNVPRILPKGLRANLQAWSVPSPFMEVKKRTGLSWQEILTSLNCGIGLVLVVSPKGEAAALKKIKLAGHQAWSFGEVVTQKSKSSEPDWQLSFEEMKGLNRE